MKEAAMFNWKSGAAFLLLLVSAYTVYSREVAAPCWKYRVLAFGFENDQNYSIAVILKCVLQHNLEFIQKRFISWVVLFMI